jgi:hypothetical protein
VNVWPWVGVVPSGGSVIVAVGGGGSGSFVPTVLDGIVTCEAGFPGVVSYVADAVLKTSVTPAGSVATLTVASKLIDAESPGKSTPPPVELAPAPTRATTRSGTVASSPSSESAASDTDPPSI